MKSKTVLLFVAVGALFLAVAAYMFFFGGGRTMAVGDVTKEQTVVLKSREANPSHATVRIRGHLDGSAVLEWDCEGTVVCSSRTTLGPGDIDAILKDGDWYSETFPINYRPSGVQSGSLEIRYLL
jgi:hypothetical protein